MVFSHENSSQVIFSVINPPINVTATRINFNSINVTWTAPAASNVLGYEVFYRVDSSNNEYTEQTVSTSNEYLQIDNLDPERNYSIFVIAFGGSNTIPSEQSNVALVPPGK